jgi:hypothetical protein
VTTPHRRSNYDVTDTVQVSSPEAVRSAVLGIFAATWPGADLGALGTAIDDFAKLFTGRMPGYLGVDTVYHDLQHTLDVVLATARLLAGYERTVDDDARLGPERALMGLVTSLFHDAGYIRESTETGVANGAVFTRSHVSRSARFIARYLPTIGLAQWTPVATRIVHFTGYEIPLDRIRVTDARDRKVGHLLGTADLLAQMSDRCYLEKCRDRLYAEFVLGGVAIFPGTDGIKVNYGSGLDLLRQTPYFVSHTMQERLERGFERAYRHVEPMFDGRNPYLEAIERNLAYLRELMRTGRWPMLRRNPPIYTVDPDPMRGVRRLMIEHLENTWGPRPSPFASTDGSGAP